ncbi:hypothetical protein BDQ94DRAFT_164567 [Aspergillus welwitschiae]|uniref:Zn(2)-C6 fungal-type domain-containing protein n=1 Tax=Aspergillus welwitschiae TaxID=1341132 RepID=A0A3F3PHW3_9EURO|nr:hypothetical protein BDQ94DRAFT_164567 [Aspergillus welwitschiae]RDH26343.1 hypothetical protein BDQ94DRAFT_164567 [Aspergillus welwitschiae]
MSSARLLCREEINNAERSHKVKAKPKHLQAASNMVPSQVKNLRILAPAPDARPSQVTDVDVRPAKRKSNACDACKKRKTRCRGDHPCDKCTQAGTECLFARGVDRRKKFALHNTEEELNAIRLLLDQLVAAFDSGSNTDVQRLIDIARSKLNTKKDTKLHKWCSLQVYINTSSISTRMVLNVTRGPAITASLLRAANP